MWLYKDSELQQLPDHCVGFVYLITNLSTGRMYVGKKLATKANTKIRVVTLKSGEKRKRKLKNRVESDWRTYYGSNKILAEEAKIDPTNYRREILHFCASKAECTYLEAKEQFARGVLESDQYYNEQIDCRIHKSNIKNKLATIVTDARGCDGSVDNESA